MFKSMLSITRYIETFEEVGNDEIKGGAGYEASTCFMEGAVSKQYQS
jgi:hypothetical protein